MAADYSVADLSGAAPPRDRLPDAAPPDPSAAAFVLEWRCVDARRVEATDGRILGRLADPACG